MPYRCVAAGCSNFPDPGKNIRLHKFPGENDRKRRGQWVNFVKAKRAKWSPTKNSCICSEHFRENDFDFQFVQLPNTPFTKKTMLKHDAVPTVHATQQVQQQQAQSSSRGHRRALRELLNDMQEPVSSNDVHETQAPTPTEGNPEHAEELHVPADQPEPAGIVVGDPVETAEENMKLTREYGTQTKRAECKSCKNLVSQNRQQRNKMIDMENKWRNRVQKYEEEITALKTPAVPANEVDENDEESEEEIFEQEPPLPEIASPEHQMFSDTETETETETEDDMDDEKPKKQYIDVKDCETENVRHQPKCIVFLSRLLLLFNICQSCKCDMPASSVEASISGTMVEVTTHCVNPACSSPKFTWRSQPNMTGTKMPAMNFLLCFSILVSGASPSKVLQVFKNMGVYCFSLQTYFRHQALKLFPTIHIFWKKYQEEMVRKLKETGQSLVIGGDGRHDSMGHSAKYCAYTIFCCTIPLIIEFSLVQRNVAGSSPAMEVLGFKNCMDALAAWNLAIGTMITDRHLSIAKHMREQLQHITHYFDLWHLKKKIHKVLTKISKEKGCEELNVWVKPCQNHLIWSATSTPSGNGQLIWAKFKSYLSHIVNKHEDLDEPLFNKCNHGDDITYRRWLREDTPVYDKVCAALTKASLVKGIKKASPLWQTSCLEGFHSVINQFCPKMIGYSFQGMYCRHIIAATHFNYNLQREPITGDDGEEKVSIIYPKFKNGEATVRSRRVKPKYEYIDRMYETFIEATKEKTLKAALTQLNAMTPDPMNTMLDKQSIEEALSVRKKRKSMVVREVPGTALNEAEPVEGNTAEIPVQSTRAQPRCRECKNPMKNHKNVKDCPKNRV